MMTRLPPLAFSLITRLGTARPSDCESVIFCLFSVSALTAEIASGVCWMLVARLSAVTTISLSFVGGGGFAPAGATSCAKAGSAANPAEHRSAKRTAENGRTTPLNDFNIRSPFVPDINAHFTTSASPMPCSRFYLNGKVVCGRYYYIRPGSPLRVQ